MALPLTDFNRAIDQFSNLTTARAQALETEGSSLYEDPSVPGWLARNFDQGGYNNWLAEKDRVYEQQSNASARAWDEYMNSTQYQRAVADLKAAGLNPWLALQSGVSAGGGSSTASSGSSARSHALSAKDPVRDVALLLLASAKLLALAAA